MNANQLLAIGAALVTAVRRNIKYSENLYLLTGNSFFDERYKKVYSIREGINATSGKIDEQAPSAYAKRALDHRVGFCSELSEVSTFLGSMLNKFEAPVYISVIKTPLHAFCLIHQSSSLHQQTKSNVYISDNIKELSEKTELENAIIVDTWIYKATKLSNYKSHINYAKEFGKQFDLEECFDGEIKTEGYSEAFGTTQPIKIAEKRLLRDFNLAYQEESRKLFTKETYSTQGRRRNSIDTNLICDSKRWGQLKDLKLFIERIASKSSDWYSSSSNRKGKSYQALIDSLDFAIQKYMDISNTDLQEIFNRALQLAPIVRGTSSFKNLWGYRNHITKTTEGLLSTDVVPEEYYKFETLPQMNLFEIRNIRSRPISQNEKCTALIQWIKKEGADPSFYSDAQKAAAYKAVDDFVSRSQGEASLLFYDRAEEAPPLAAEASAASFKSF
ncbi:hypothetical protein AVI51_16555 (plasmid) [Piscirickettsia salmonis]|uniref:hypothetical protein n=1 Tax=Piscirickettsia salmonis TaxID=1238 RepID=UPI00030981A5|nr:hypothetical protein [Piscirickettsia salmonis]ALA26728.1 hypothetical protein KW89_4p10 [Piscirickettsia salmonis]APS49393.1 hypothetical protein AVI49_17210 [Piscirickettsia salmonis]APS52546.1 hypothetical protein AVI50_16990 [Piscirickettsia salmonis]APS55713.1 hypothetical protein AVI51_16555 [Piscirickettsia salmonis]APS59045.1 hypothetical protein AVI52_17570 [Piscirickettsia salmonis]